MRDEETFRRWSLVEGSWVIGGVSLEEIFISCPSSFFLQLGYYKGFVQLPLQKICLAKGPKATEPTNCRLKL